jgi:hypothetical protein
MVWLGPGKEIGSPGREISNMKWITLTNAIPLRPHTPSLVRSKANEPIREIAP